jgi:hypothetical protein
MLIVPERPDSFGKEAHMDRRTFLTGSMDITGKIPASEELDRACADKRQA